jgi:hypothetical protein
MSGRNALDREARRGDRILIHVQLGDAQPARKLGSQFFDHGRNHPARPTPGRPHIDHYGQGRALHLVRKVFVADLD